ncbi:MAG: 16S rRNA (cytosine(967)-C(5))-methyltransferase RsmB [Alcanivorax sp.]|nr:16S rRNA (cytosine(967)-C(5))-methyltransferase RsmB [Alcanivorax sp.]
MTADPRWQAVKALRDILPANGQGHSLREAMKLHRQPLEGSARGLMADLCFGVCRHRTLLEHWLNQQLQKPLKASALDVRLALLCGIYERWFTDRPAHAVVNAYPDLCRTLKAPWAAGLTNAVLRKAGNVDPVAYAASLPVEQACSLPRWLWQQWQADWPEQAEAIARASITEAPLTLRANRRYGDRDGMITALAAQDISAQPGTRAPFAIYLDQAISVEQLPGFRDGVLSVQDEAAQLPAELIEAPEHGRILDACAAPGGKTGQLAERFPLATLVALDQDERRLKRVRETLKRLGADATVVAGDAAAPDSWWDGVLFDAILLDAPCSATGILRRQPDVKWHRRADDIPALVGLQARMLDALWPLISPGGMLVYATCSTLMAENAAQVSAFLARQGDARDDTPGTLGSETLGDLPVSAGAQLLPQEGRHDGFYVARLRKTTIA